MKRPQRISSVVCAWCLAEKNEQPSENDSHGICKKHSQQVLAEHKLLVAQRKHAGKK